MGSVVSVRGSGLELDPEVNQQTSGGFEIHLMFRHILKAGLVCLRSARADLARSHWRKSADGHHQRDRHRRIGSGHPNATVTITNKATNISPHGEPLTPRASYSAPALQAGDYDVRGGNQGIQDAGPSGNGSARRIHAGEHADERRRGHRSCVPSKQPRRRSTTKPTNPGRHPADRPFKICR